MSILEVNDVSIRYMTGDFKDIGLKEYVTRKLNGNYHVNEFWADKNISFTLEKGDMLGIIGTNGAGKSTLLKAVSGIMEPTGGYVKREGNIAALLELASGFDGDLTVRENAYLRGAMLGYTRRFMDEKYDEIIDFAELRDFQDRPFKQLSSGMKSRLAFSIASLVQPDILILDEVLSVGDGAFRKKSEEKMREIIASGATTILVSHSIQQVREMCNKVLWLDHGEQVEFGENVEEICDHYQEFLGIKDFKSKPSKSGHIPPQAKVSEQPPSNAESDAPKEKIVKKFEVENVYPQKESGPLYGPEYALKKAMTSIPFAVWVAVMAALVFGFITHIQSFSGFILNWDSVKDSLYSVQSGGTGLLSQGKWLSPVLPTLLKTVLIGSANGIAAVLYISLSAGIVVWTLKIRNVIFSGLVGMLMVSFPSVMSSFSYAGEEFWYLTLLMAVLAVYLTATYKYGFIGGIVCLTLSLGNYQAFIGAAASMFVFLCILDLLQTEKTEWEVIKTGLKYVAVLLISILFYYGILQLALHVTGTPLATYRGIDSVLSGFSVKNLWEAAVGSYEKVLRFFWDDAYGRADPRDIWAYHIAVLVGAAAVCIAVKRNEVYRKPLRMLILGTLVFLMPLAVHAIGILGQNPNTHWIMIYSFVLIFVFIAKLSEALAGQNHGKTENTVPENEKRQGNVTTIAVQWAAVGILVSILMNWFTTTNMGYARLKASFEGAYANSLIMMQEVLELPDYSPDKPLAVIGKDKTYTGDVFGSSLNRFTGVSGGRNFLIDNTRRVAFIRDYIGINLPAASTAKSAELSKTAEFKEMPCYPSPGFAKVIDGCLVVKLSDVN